MQNVFKNMVKEIVPAAEVLYSCITQSEKGKTSVLK